jgi:hypothetical protein
MMRYRKGAYKDGRDRSPYLGINKVRVKGYHHLFPEDYQTPVKGGWGFFFVVLIIAVILVAMFLNAHPGFQIGDAAWQIKWLIQTIIPGM